MESYIKKLSILEANGELHKTNKTQRRMILVKPNYIDRSVPNYRLGTTDTVPAA